MTRRVLLVPRVLEFTRTRRLLERGNRVLVAVSGGPDSMVLLHLLVEIRGALGVDLAVGHVDHGLRKASAKDAEFVARQAAALGLPYFERRVDVRAHMEKTRTSMETAAREVRYGTLAALAIESGADRIATGHTATDQAETVLMRILRGTGPLGLAGIEAVTVAGIVRPLLCATATEVRTHASDRGIQVRNDPSNSDPRHFRNRVRMDLLPRLRTENPRIDFVLADLAQDAATLSRAVADTLATGSGNQTLLPRPESQDPLLPYRIRAAFERVTGAPLGLSRTHLDAIVRLMTTPGATGEVHLPRRVLARVDRHGLSLQSIVDGPPPGSSSRKRDGRQKIT